MNKKAEKIINTTIHLFLKEGIKKVTMDDIAYNAKSSKVTVYKYFLDKDTLYLEVGRFIFQKYTQRLIDVVSKSDKLINRIQQYLNILCEFTDTGHLALCKELAKYNLDVNNERDSYLQTYKDTLFTLIDQGIEEKQIKAELDRLLVFSYIDMGVEYYQSNDSYNYMINNDKQFQESYMSFYLSNIFKKSLF